MGYHVISRLLNTPLGMTRVWPAITPTPFSFPRINRSFAFGILKRLSLLILCTPVFIFTTGSCAHVVVYRPVATCHIQYTFLSLCKKFHEEMDKNTKMAADVY